MARQKLFEYAILYHPRRIKKDEEEGVYRKSEIVTTPTMVLAEDIGQVQMIAAKSIPQEHFDKGTLDCLEIAVRPF